MSLAQKFPYNTETLFPLKQVPANQRDRKLICPALHTARGVLYHTDCLKLFAALHEDSVDCMFADPPFNLGKDYGNGTAQDTLGREDYLRWCFKWLDQCVRVLKPGGSVFVYILPQWGYHLAAHLESRGMM